MHKKQRLSNGIASTEVNGTNTESEATEQKAVPKQTKSREEMLEYVEGLDAPFNVDYVRDPSNSKKRKRSAPDNEKSKKVLQDSFEHESSFHTRLNCRYKITPKDNWLSMRPYKKFTLTHQNGEGTTTISVGDCVLVVGAGVADAVKDESEMWKAKVLQVRAIDAEHAYVLVAWLSRPEDFEKIGRQPWQGADELIPTNQLDVIEALAVNGRINVRYLPDSKEDDDEGEIDSPDVDSTVRYYWRQTFDYAGTQKFSPLEKICIDDQPRSPDEVAVQCQHTECGKWMHAHCIANQAIRTARADAKMSKASDKDLQTPEDIPANAQAGATDGHYIAHVYLSSDNNEPTVDNERDNSEIVLLESGSVLRRLPIECLFCGHSVD